MAKVTFETLNPNAPLFSELKSGKYAWWENIKQNHDLYIEIRKDNNINVYFQGGSVVKLHYCSKHKKITPAFCWCFFLVIFINNYCLIW